MSLFEIRDLEVVYRGRRRLPVRAVAGVSVSVDRGEIVGLVGESGCGKSSLARAAVGLEVTVAGDILLEGLPLQPLNRRARSRRDQRVQMVFQNPYASLNPRRQVGKQIANGLLHAGFEPLERRTRVATLLETVGLTPDAARRYPHEFSGGQRQRIAIARALASDPDIIVLDEPLSSLDASAQAQVANLLVRLAREQQVGLLLISHDLGIVHHISHRVFVMYLGEIVESGPTAEVWETPRHPYTQALISAVPSIDRPSQLPVALAGEVPDPARPPSGCRFSPRCAAAFDRCRTERPAAYEVGRERQASCFLNDPAREYACLPVPQ
jgi:oligopeptide/dipeptide ABC transporter ATP-binding protein